MLKICEPETLQEYSAPDQMAALVRIWQRRNKMAHQQAEPQIYALDRYARGQPTSRMTGVDGQHASAGFALP